MKKILLISVCLFLAASIAYAKKKPGGNGPASVNARCEIKGNVSDNEMYPVRAAAAQETTYLAYYNFDDFHSCDAQGWTSVDMTAQHSDFFHVDDFAACEPGSFGRLYAIEGTQSMWCGVCPDPGDDILCRYAVLPGYGNSWDQAFCTRNCVFVDSFATVDYLIMWDSEPGYDATSVEYVLCEDSWLWSQYGQQLNTYDDIGGPAFASDVIPVVMDSIRVRFHFTSDGAWSDQDGLWDTDGAVIIDSLTVRCAGAGIVVPTELFEDESVGDKNATDWESCNPPGFGDLTQLIRAIPTAYQNDPVQEDPCASNFTCMWNFVKGSTYNYECNRPNPSPQQPAIPYVNARNQYLHNEIWSPWIPFTGTGAGVNLEFDVYRDVSIDAKIFYFWHVSWKDANGTDCPSEWLDRNFVYWGGNKDWFREVQAVGDLIPSNATHIRIALAVEDYCQWWCCVMGGPGCHSHAPMLDNVAVYRVHSSGPQFFVRDIDMFQDNFSADGTITGPARADMAQDILDDSNPNILPGDSVCITVNDPEVGLGADSYTGCGPAVYCYLSVDRSPGSLIASDIEAPETRAGCGARFPYVTTTAAAGRAWHVFRMDTCFTTDGVLVEDRYCIDLNDNLFVPGDTCWFFFGAKNSTGTWNYYSLPYGHSTSISLVAGEPDEFTILPANCLNPDYTLLYVDGFNLRGAQPFFDNAFRRSDATRPWKIDRYDIRGPDSGVGNRLGGRVVDVNQQMIGIYKRIIWNTGDLTLGCIGDGVGYEKSDDATMLYDWIHQMPNTGGIYFSGDDLPKEWATLTGAGAIALRNYCNFTLVSGDHVASGAGINPAGKYAPGGTVFFASESLIVYGGCPVINDFDIIAAVPPLSHVEMNYHHYVTNANAGGAIVSQTTVNNAGYDVTIILSGFSFHNIRDIDTSYSWPTRETHLGSILRALHEIVGLDHYTATNPASRRTSLAQNYPNPFNPVTTIKYTLREQAHVSLKVYNVAGQLVRTLIDEVQKPDGVRPVEWRGLNNSGQPVASGVYFYRLVTKDFTKTRKMVLLK